MVYLDGPVVLKCSTVAVRAHTLQAPGVKLLVSQDFVNAFHPVYQCCMGTKTQSGFLASSLGMGTAYTVGSHYLWQCLGYEALRTKTSNLPLLKPGKGVRVVGIW